MTRDLDPAHLGLSGKEKGKLGECSLEGLGEPSGWWWHWVGSELIDVLPGAEEIHFSGKKGAGGRGERHQRGLLPGRS